MKKIILIVMIFINTIMIKAQAIDDALNLTHNNAVISSRAGALGISYYGVSDDFSAIAFNPAGLSLIDKGEIAFGFGFAMNGTSAEYLFNTNESNSNYGAISNFGIVAPFTTEMGNATIAIGYYQEAVYDNSMQFGGLNINSSFINFTARDAKARGWGIGENFATDLYLADDNYETPLKNWLYQDGTINESGNRNNLSGAISFELNKNLSVGFALTGKWGSYEYIRNFNESDTEHKYEELVQDSIDGKLVYTNIDFKQVRVLETINQDQTGITGSFGLMGKFGDFMRLGFAVKLPTFYSISETFVQSSVADFDNEESFNDEFNAENSYAISSPWVYAAGMSFHFLGTTISTALEYTDITQIEFSSALSELQSKNQEVKSLLSGELKFGAGVEYEIPGKPIILRGSYDYQTASYKDALPGEEITNIGIGAGVFLADNIRLDILSRISNYKKMWYLYKFEDDPGYDSRIVFERNPIDFSLHLTYRY